MLYADIILPLGFEGLYTYSVPPMLEARVKPFVRAVVPLGRSQTYTGVIVSVHCNRPASAPDADGNVREMAVKDILEVVDAEPVLFEYQYKLWQWLSDYYLCPIGDVLRAAFPSGMKQEGAYRPKTETYIRLSETYRSEASINVALNMVRRAQRQYEVLMTYLRLSHYDTIKGTHCPTSIEEITREELINATKTTTTIVKSLVTRGILETYEVEVGRLNFNRINAVEPLSPLTEPQQRAFNEILSEDSAHRPVLLHGVTGSGKTEIYMHLIQRCIDEGRQVLYLLPEIALTVQIMQRLRRVFGSRLGIFHSRYSDAERVEIWQKQMSSEPYDVILGARSAVFLPFSRLGLIIIDEEHETSFKQQDPAPRYHARSLAMMTARHFPDVRIVMGTATPSIESYHNAVTGKYRLVQLSERYKGMQLPKIDIVNIADLQRRKMMYGPFSPMLVDALREAVSNGKQAILFQNRRGFAPMIECRECGWVPKCENCDVTLTMHKTTSQLTCHYCGYTYTTPQKCPSCFCTDIRERGFGTERIEEKLSELGFTGIARMDLDTTRTKNAYERIIHEFSAGKTQILIGTQMVSKGLDFENVSVVGILNADTMLNYPDFRAYEQAFQMLCQVSGRAGRKGQRGRVILQTKHPDLPVIDQVVRNDYATFYTEQCDERQMFSYPPYTRVVNIYLRHAKDTLADSAATEMSGRLRQYFGRRVLGPDKPPVARVKRMNIRKIVLKLENGINLPKVRECLRYIRNEILTDKRYASLHIYYDVDPL